jgi:hypothetical protein
VRKQQVTRRKKEQKEKSPPENFFLLNKKIYLIQCEFIRKVCSLLGLLGLTNSVAFLFQGYKLKNPLTI